MLPRVRVWYVRINCENVSIFRSNITVASSDERGKNRPISVQYKQCVCVHLEEILEGWC